MDFTTDKSSAITRINSTYEKKIGTARHRSEKTMSPSGFTSPTLSQNNTKIVYNLSDRQLSKAVAQVLSKGFNYIIAPKKLTVNKIECGVDNAKKFIPDR
ncbi:hypothetical protein Trydic_g1280 [Trypoxylus dichotomus]